MIFCSCGNSVQTVVYLRWKTAKKGGQVGNEHLKCPYWLNLQMYLLAIDVIICLILLLYLLN